MKRSSPFNCCATRSASRSSPRTASTGAPRACSCSRSTAKWRVSLSTAFAEGHVGKRYLAVVRGWPAEQGSIDYPLSRQPDEAEWIDPRATLAPQPALTHWRRPPPHNCRCQRPLPGDTHRVARTSTGHGAAPSDPPPSQAHRTPIIGDATHGGGRDQPRIRRLHGVQPAAAALCGARTSTSGWPPAAPHGAALRYPLQHCWLRSHGLTAVAAGLSRLESHACCGYHPLRLAAASTASAAIRIHR